MKRKSSWVYVAAAAMLGAGCRSDAPRMDATPVVAEPPAGLREEILAPPSVRPPVEMLQRQADALEGAVRDLRDHISAMRQLPSGSVSGAMERHVSELRALAQRLQAQRAELTVTDAELPRLLGMSREEHHSMLEEIVLAAAELGEMRAGEAAFRERLPEHLDRLERIADGMTRAAAALRR